jgi:hypothetical protein
MNTDKIRRTANSERVTTARLVAATPRYAKA